MGLSMSWMAVQAEDEAAALRNLGFRPIGEVSDPLRELEVMARSPGGWIVIVSTGRSRAYEGMAQAASANYVTLAGQLDEVVMVSSLRAYREGELEWSVVHDLERTAESLSVKGSPPSELAGIRRQAEAEAAAGDKDVDYVFDVPLQLSTAITGFDVCGGGASVWTVLGPAGEKEPPARSKNKRSIRAAIEDRLIPLMLERGWRRRTKADGAGWWALELHRRWGQMDQTVGFEFEDVNEGYVEVAFSISEGEYPKTRKVLEGDMRPRKQTLRELFFGRPAPKGGDRRSQAMEDAERRLMALEDFLSGRATSETIWITGGVAEKTWPIIPPRAED